MENFRLNLSSLPRKLHFPVNVLDCGYCIDAIGGGAITRDNTLEFAIRLGSSSPFAVDIVQGIEHRHTFPHAVVRAPGMSYISQVERPREIFFMIFSETSVPFIKETGISTDFACLPIPDLTMVRTCIMNVCQLRGKLFEKGVADQIDILTFKLMYDICLKQSIPENNDFYHERILQIAKELRQGIKTKLDVDSLCHRHGLSRRTFFRYWSKHFAISPKTYVEELRLQEGMRLLTETTLSVSDIARQLTYPSLSYFCEHFRKRFHQTPSQTRKQQRDLG